MTSSPLPSSLPPARRRAEALCISLAGGLLLFLALRYAAAGPLLAAAYVVLMLPAVGERWRAPFVGFIPGQIGGLIAANMALSKFAWFVPWLIVPILMGHYFLQALFAFLLRRATGWPAFVVIPLAVGAGEWTRGPLGVGNFNMFQVGTFLFEYPRLIQIADVVGSYGLSVLWTIPFAALVDIASWWRAGRPADRRRVALAAAAASVAVLVGLPLYGTWRLSNPEFRPGPRLAVVQPSLEHGVELTPEVVQQQARMTVDAVAPGAADMIVWPENAVLAAYEHVPNYRGAIEWVVRTRETPLLFGAQGKGLDDRPTCVSLLADVDGSIVGRYEKVVLFPFTERRAFRGLETVWPWLGRTLTRLTLAAWEQAPDGWSPDEPAVMTLPPRTRDAGAAGAARDAGGDVAGGEGVTFWSPLCYESCYPELGRAAYAKGARLFVNLTSEGWLGWAVSNNQMGANVLRAVENRVGLVRAGNTGPSAFILPDGRIEQYLRGARTGRLRLEAGTLVAPVTLGAGGPTFYTRFGGPVDAAWFTTLALATLAGFVLEARARARARARSRTARRPGPDDGGPPPPGVARPAAEPADAPEKVSPS